MIKGIGYRDKLLLVLLTCCMAFAIAMPHTVGGYVAAAVSRCLDVLIPSLFAFMAYSELLIMSGSYILLSKLLFPFRLLTGLPSGLCPVFLISNIAGYPVGASMICTLYDAGKLSRHDASRLICFCYNGGPAFFSGAVGLAVYGSSKVGMFVYLSVLIVNILGVSVSTRISEMKCSESEAEMHFRCDMLSSCVSRAGMNLLKICGTVLLFSGMLACMQPLYDLSGISGNIRCLIASFIEISGLSSMERNCYSLLPYITAASAFGGLCVIFQVISIVDGRFSLFRFVITRIVCAAASAGVFILLWKAFGDDSTAVMAENRVIVNMNNFIPSVCLIMMIFLTFSRKNLQSIRTL